MTSYAYDPQGGAYGFSPIGFPGKACGAGDTEECRWTTAMKYRVNIANFRSASGPSGQGGYTHTIRLTARSKATSVAISGFSDPALLSVDFAGA